LGPVLPRLQLVRHALDSGQDCFEILDAVMTRHTYLHRTLSLGLLGLEILLEEFSTLVNELKGNINEEDTSTLEYIIVSRLKDIHTFLQENGEKLVHEPDCVYEIDLTSS